MSAPSSKGPIFDPGLCRCCGTLKKCRLLNVEYEILGQKEVYSDMIMDCFGLLISYLDGKPTERLICATCVRRLREALGFRKQVLQCEEVFLQLKMNYSKTEEPQTKLQHKVEIDIVKTEPDDSEPGSPCHDALADDTHYDEIKPEASPVEHNELNQDSNSNDDLPLKRPIKRVVDVPSTAPSAKRPAPAPTRAPLVKKQKLPMSKVQQMMRERDPTYMMETNILAIVEYSYVCPFKCRHNHLICYYCGENFADPALLRSHTDRVHHPKRFKVTEHKYMVKLDITRIDCRLCPMKINNLEEFKKHIMSVHNKQYYLDHKDSVLPFKLSKDNPKCAICDVVFPYFHALNKHMNEHFSNYVCETCGLGFVDKGRFMMHLQRHEEGDYPCQTCGKVFKANYNRDLHIDRVHNKRGRVNCPKCDVMLMSYQQKLKHLVEVHGEVPLSFPCPLCERVFDTRRTLTIHRRKDHLKDFRYECQICGQKFFTRFALNNHMPTHTGERNFKCKVCEKSYPRLKTLKDHMRIHTNDRRYRCHICGQAFIQNCSLKGHMKSQHPEYG